MKAVTALLAVAALVTLALLGGGVAGLRPLFGVIVPYVALALFIGGFAYRILSWARSPVPFRIPTTAGQAKSLDWIPSDRLDNPHDTAGVVGRMLLEVLLFRSLFRNTSAEIHQGRLTYGSTKWLWLTGLVFHWSFLLIALRHLRFFTDPIPAFVTGLASVDGFLEVGVPTVYLTGVALLVAVTYLFLRRIVSPTLRYISLPSDYFPLFLILGIGLTGLFLRHFVRTDVTSAKELMTSLVSFQPNVPETLQPLFLTHLFLVSILLAYFPFSKLMHAGGVFLSPTRNLANNNRAVRHVNPWAKPAKLHTYEAYEDEFRERMVQAGIPVDREPAPAETPQGPSSQPAPADTKAGKEESE